MTDFIEPSTGKIKRKSSNVAPKRTKRYFEHIDSSGECLGKYSGTTLKQAAGKAFIRACRKSEKNGESINECTLLLREITKDPPGEISHFKASRKKLPEPVKIKLPDGKEIIYEYSNHIKNM